MEKSVLIYLKNKKNYYNYFKENSYWIKNFNRKENVKNFEEFIKEKYHLRMSDKVNNVIDNLDLINIVLSNVQ